MISISENDNRTYDRLVGILLEQTPDDEPLSMDADDALRRIIKERDAYRWAAFCAKVVLEHERDVPEDFVAPFKDRYEMHHWDELEKSLAVPEIKDLKYKDCMKPDASAGSGDADDS